MSEPVDERIRVALEGYDAEILWRHQPLRRAIKRTIDVVIAFFLLLLGWPVIAGTALAVRLTSRGPVLLTQTRLGTDGKPFRMMKFRSMKAETSDGFVKVETVVTGRDPRLTPIGGFIRASRLDELPQLLHVLNGEMSLVGPRPELPENLHRYSDYQLIRFGMPQGCTCTPAIRGAFNNSWDERQDMMANYVREWTPWYDLKIFFGSLIVVALQKDVVEKGA